MNPATDLIANDAMLAQIPTLPIGIISRGLIDGLVAERKALEEEFGVRFKLFVDTTALPADKQALRTALETVDAAFDALVRAIEERDEIIDRLRGVDPATD